MLDVTPLLSACRRTAVAAVLAVAASCAVPAVGTAQQVVTIVNGDPITAYDIEQRIKLTQMTSHKSQSRQEALQELIDEKLKLQLLKRYNIEGVDNDVDNAFNGMARRGRMTPKQLTEQIGRNGVSAASLKSRIKAELIWSQIIRGKYQSSLQISEKDITSQLATAGADAKADAGFDYSLRPILFIVDRRSPEGARETRRREAEALRARFDNCTSGIAFARNLRDIAIRTPITKSSADLTPSLREILEKTEVGKLTPPETTEEGIQVYALCSKRPSTADNSPVRKAAREKLFQEKFEKQAKQYLQELRSQAMIENR